MLANNGNEQYHAEIRILNNNDWSYGLQLFDDATVYQTLAYGTARWGNGNLCHIVIKKGSRIVSIAQVRIVAPPFFRGGIAYVGWGPLWKLKNEEDSLDNLSHMLKVLKKEFVLERKMYLRVYPYCFWEDPNSSLINETFVTEGYHHSSQNMRTLILDLSRPLDELRMNTRRKWRQVLGYAERENLTLISGLDEKLLAVGIDIYKEMQQRKQFAEFADYNKLVTIQKYLPQALKFQNLICYVDGVPAAALTWAVVGSTGLPVLAATGLVGREKNASYLLWWKMVESLKSQGLKSLDLGGVNPERNPGSYVFKTGLAGKLGREVNYLGHYDACESRSSLLLFTLGNRVRATYRAAQLALEKRRRGPCSGISPRKRSS